VLRVYSYFITSGAILRFPIMLVLDNVRIRLAFNTR